MANMVEVNSRQRRLHEISVHPGTTKCVTHAEFIIHVEKCVIIGNLLPSSNFVYL